MFLISLIHDCVRKIWRILLYYELPSRHSGKKKQTTIGRRLIRDNIWPPQETITDPDDEWPHKPATTAFIWNVTPGGTGRFRLVHRRRRQLLPRRRLYRTSGSLQGTGKGLFTTKRQRGVSVNADKELHQNGVTAHFGATPFFSMRIMLQASSQRWHWHLVLTGPKC